MKPNKKPETFTTLFSTLKSTERDYTTVNAAYNALYEVTGAFERPDLSKLLTAKEIEVLEKATGILDGLAQSIHDKGGIVGKKLLKIA